MEYYAWEEPGRLVTKTATLTVAGVVPIDRGDRKMAPTYPGHHRLAHARRLGPAVSGRPSPHPPRGRGVLGEVPDDAEGVRAARSRAAAVADAIRVDDLDSRSSRSRAVARPRRAISTHSACVPRPIRSRSGSAVIDVRAQGLEASRGATDFGEYFVYFSFFIVVSALLLVALFFKLGIEQRVREVGLLRAVGFGPARVRRLFLQEGVLLAVVGSVLGIVGRARLCVADDVRTAIVVGRCRRHDGAHAARLARVARRRRDRRRRCRDRVHLVDAACAGSHLRAEPAAWERSRTLSCSTSSRIRVPRKPAPAEVADCDA